MTKHIPIRVRQGSELLCYDTRARAVPNDFSHPQLALFIHGFTAHGEYLFKLMDQVKGAGVRCFYFNYETLKGIDRAAESLAYILAQLDLQAKGALRKAKLTFVCHSMGGLVARALSYMPEGECFMRALVTLGTPHAGTLESAEFIKHFANFGAHITHDLPGFNKSTFRSAKQLMRTDTDDGQTPLLDRLQFDNATLRKLPVLSFSGGKDWVEVDGTSFLGVRNFWAHEYLKLNLNLPNDGLIEETSSDITKLPEVCRGNKAAHDNLYPDYLEVNHSHLVNRQTIAATIATWIQGLQS